MGKTDKIFIEMVKKPPLLEDKYGKKHRACWKLLKRDDKGSVYTLPESQYGEVIPPEINHRQK